MKHRIEGGVLPVLYIDLEPQEKIIVENNAMSWMNTLVKSDQARGGVGRFFGKMMSGETLFHTTYQAQNESGMIAIASKFPGSIKAIKIENSNSYNILKRAFLACEVGVDISAYYQRNLNGGLFGTEGLTLHKLTGKGTAFIEISGHEVEYNLKENESMIIDSGHLVAVNSSCTLEYKSLSNTKNSIFGGDGLHYTVISGPGKIILQSMPINKFIKFTRFPYNK